MCVCVLNMVLGDLNVCRCFHGYANPDAACAGMERQCFYLTPFCTVCDVINHIVGMLESYTAPFNSALEKSEESRFCIQVVPKVRYTDPLDLKINHATYAL